MAAKKRKERKRDFYDAGLFAPLLFFFCASCAFSRLPLLACLARV